MFTKESLQEKVDDVNKSFDEIIKDISLFFVYAEDNTIWDLFKDPLYFTISTEEIQNILKNYKINNADDIVKCIPMINILLHKSIQIKKSTIPKTDMFGLFANKKFYENDVICAYGGYKIFGNSINALEYQRDYKDVARITAYWVQGETKDVTIDGYLYFALNEPGRFANSHLKIEKCNARFLEDSVGRINLVATQKIVKGEEIFVEYGCSYAWDAIYPNKTGNIRKYCPEFVFRTNNYYGIHDLQMDLKINKKDIVNILKKVEHTLNKTHHGSVLFFKEVLVTLQTFKIDPLYFAKLFDTYMIKEIEDYKQSYLVLEIMAELDIPGLFGLLKYTKERKVVAAVDIKLGTLIGSIGGILTDKDVFSNTKYFSFKKTNRKLFLFPYLCYNIKYLCNVAKKDKQFKSNCYVYVNKKNECYVYARRDIKEGGEIMIKKGRFSDEKETSVIDLHTSFITSKCLSSTNVGLG